MRPTGRPPLERTSIITAARDLIRVGGLEALSLRRLASVLGVTAAALYAHVADKEDLLRSVAEIEFSHLVDAYETVPAGSPTQRIAALARAYVDHARSEPELFRVMFLFPPAALRSNAPGPAALPAATTAFSMGSTAVADAMADGSIEAGDVLETRLLFWAASHGVASILQLELGLDPRMEEQLVARMIERLLAGYAPDLQN